MAKDEEQREIERRAIESIQKKNTIKTGIERNDFVHEEDRGGVGHAGFLNKMKSSGDDLKEKLMARVKQPGQSEEQSNADSIPAEPKISSIPKSMLDLNQNQPEKTTTFQ